MVQIYLLSILYLFFSSCLLLVDKYGSVVLFLINLKTFFYSKKAIRIGSLVLGLLIVAGLLAFPIAPGPVVIGDILPAISIIIVILYFIRQEGRDAGVAEFNDNKRNALGFFTLGVALVHFLFPTIVLL